MRAALPYAWSTLARRMLSNQSPCPGCLRPVPGLVCGACAAASCLGSARTASVRFPHPGYRHLYYCAVYRRPLGQGLRNPMSPLAVALADFKYHGSRRNGHRLGAVFAEHLSAQASNCDVLVAVPSAPLRLRRRGFNQAAWLAHALARRSGTPLLHRAILRRDGARPQRGLALQPRRENAVGLFRPSVHAYRLHGKRVLLIDDVVTTGATLADAGRTLRLCGAEMVDAAVLLLVERTGVIKCPSRIATDGRAATERWDSSSPRRG